MIMPRANTDITITKETVLVEVEVLEVVSEQEVVLAVALESEEA